ncbi:hypothetical protein GCM10023065_02870 [Microbacterium laevaniformans]|jgi:hypothetical protein
MQLLARRVTAVVITAAIGVVSFGVATSVVAQSRVQPAGAGGAAPTGAASDASAAVEELKLGQVTDVRVGSDIVFPVDSYRMSPEDQNVVFLAEHKAMQSCMARFGESFDVPPQTVPAESHDYDRLFGVLDLAQAQSTGYHVVGDEILESGEGAGIAEKDASSLDERALDIAMGDGSDREINGQTVPAGGCISEARSITGDDGSSQALLESTVAYGLRQSDRDPRVLAAFRSWSECMKANGFTYETPAAAINDPKWATSKASAAEIQVAASDVNCKLSTGLTGLRVAVASAWQDEYISSHADEFKSLSRGDATKLAKARSLLATSR